MPLIDQMKMIIDEYEAKANQLEFNAKMIDIYEGNLLHYLKKELAANLDKKAYEALEDRIVPINILRRMIDKMSKIYQKGVVRRVADGSDADSELLTEYETDMRMNDRMNRVNEYYNMFKYGLARPVAFEGRKMLNAVANDRYFVISTDPIDPMRVTHLVYIDRVEETKEGKKRIVFHAWTDTEFLIFDDDMEVRTSEMQDLGNVEGINPFGVIDAEYFNRSTNYLMPKPDFDLYAMVILIPVLMTDLAYAIKFQSFSITYGIDIDFENMKRAPNALWLFKTDKKIGTDAKPTVGTIKPDVDIGEVISYIQSTLSIFLQTRGIRPGAVGQLTAENFSSGISKMIDEMDTFEDRNSQISTFGPGDAALTNRIVKKLHPVWSSQRHVENNHKFSANASVNTDFPEQIPMQDRGQIVKDQQAEVDAGFTTRKRAIKKLNPGMSEDEIEDLMAEIDADKGVTPQSGEQVEGDATDVSGVIPDEVVSEVTATLNGAQVASLVNVLNQVSGGVLPKESARAIIIAAFGLPNELLDRILNPIKPVPVDDLKELN